MLAQTVKAAASLAGIGRKDLAAAMGLALPQGVTNKYNRDSFSGDDLIKIAAACGYRLAFVDDNGKAVLTFPEPAPAEVKEG